MSELDKRLEEIKEINEEAITVNLNGDPNMELRDIVMRQWQREHIDWLIEQAEENKRLREALEFYAGEDNNLLVDGENTNVSIDAGRIARKALGVEEK